MTRPRVVRDLSSTQKQKTKSCFKAGISTWGYMKWQRTTQKQIMRLIHTLLPGQENKTVLKIDRASFHILVNVASLLQSFSCRSSFCCSLASSQVDQTQPTHLLPARLQKKEHNQVKLLHYPKAVSLLWIGLFSIQLNDNLFTFIFAFSSRCDGKSTMGILWS